MIDIKRVFPECNADTLLVEILLERGRARHYSGIGEVSKAMKAYTNATHTTVGLVDGEKFINDDKFIQSFKEIERFENIALFHIPDSKRYLIKLIPSFEDWLIATGAGCGVAPNDYNYTNLGNFRKDCKRELVHQNKNIRNFIKAVVRANPPAMKQLKGWLLKIAED